MSKRREHLEEALAGASDYYGAAWILGVSVFTLLRECYAEKVPWPHRFRPEKGPYG